MTSEFTVLPHVTLAPDATTVRPAQPRFLSMDAAATSVMTDFAQVWAVTVAPDVPIDDALERMKRAGVRMLLVVDGRERVVGLITAKDIQGERPVKLVSAGGITRHQIKVADVMAPQSAIEVFTMASIANARVGHVLHTLLTLERQHGLVVEVDDGGGHRIRGVFSTSEIGKRLGQPATEIVTSAHSLAELQEVRSSGA